MTKLQLIEAMKIGSISDKTDDNLGKFGYGLITSTLSMATTLEIKTKITNADRGYLACLNFNDMIENNNFNGTIDDIPMTESGTILYSL